MEQRLRELKRLTSAMQSRKKAMEIRLALLNTRLAALTSEYQTLLQASDEPELVPGTHRHYVYRMGAIDQQLIALRHQVSQLSLLRLKAGADLRRAEIIEQREADAASRLRSARHLEEVMDTRFAVQR